MTEALVPVVAVPALIAAGWTAAGLRAVGSPRWIVGALVAGGLAAALVLIAAFLPLLGSFGTLGVPLLCVAAGALLLWLFARLYAVAVALSVPFALFMVLQPPLFPLLLPLVLTLPLWIAGWLERERGIWRYALTILIAVVVVPAAVFGAFFLLRGQA